MSIVNKVSPKECSICGNQFYPTRGDRQRLCSNDSCKEQNKSKIYHAWRVRTGRHKPKENLWSQEDKQAIIDNRYMSTAELSLLLGRSKDSVKEKRSKLKLPMLAVCVLCGETHKYINQHKTCAKCAPTQKEYRDNYKDTINGRWQMYKSNAKKRGLEFELTLKDMEGFWKKPCEYCGSEIEIVGIDRVDSTKGYISGNLVPCCGRCNEMKNSATVSEWVLHMKKVLANLENRQ